MKKIYYNGRFHTMVPSSSANTMENASEPSSTRSSAAVDVGSPQSSPSSAVDAICCEDGVITAVGRYDDFSEELLRLPLTPLTMRRRRTRNSGSRRCCTGSGRL